MAAAFSGALSEAVCVEIFCGKARLSKKLRNKLFQVFSVDHEATKGVPILRIDIANANQRAVLEELLEQDKVLYVHFAPPCGTASAAREIQPGPPPLRSINFPMGLPHLNFVQSTRVRKANFLYAWTCKTVMRLNMKGIGWSIENPASSLMWITEPFVDLLQAIGNIIAFLFTPACLQPLEKRTQPFGRPSSNSALIWNASATVLTSILNGAALHVDSPQQKNAHTMTICAPHGLKPFWTSPSNKVSPNLRRQCKRWQLPHSPRHM